MHAGIATAILLRKDGHGGGIRMPAELAGTALEQHTGGFDRHRRQRIRLRAGWLEWIGAGLTGDTKFPFRFRVIRFEVGVGDGPVGEASTRNGAYLGRLDEINLMES